MSKRIPAWAALSTAVAVLSMPEGARAQLEEITVTAQRRETNIQDTPISIQAFTAEQLEFGGIERGEDLGIMVPNVVLSGSTGQGQGLFYIRGLPGVGIYVDGVWQGSFGFNQTNLVEMERVEVLRGPQGTLFGRNTNGGAINMTTRAPADEFGARFDIDVGEFNRRDMTVAVDLPFSDTVKTKWMASSLRNDGFLDSVTVPRSFGDQDDTLLRADILWEPTDDFSLRVTANDEDKAGTDARIVRFTNTQHPRYLAYNILAGNPDFLATARAIDPSFPDPPKQLAGDRFTPETHEPGYPGGTLDKWETRSDTMEDGLRSDVQYYTMTIDWDIGDRLNFESITSGWEMTRRQVIDFDGSEFTITTDDIWDYDKNFTQEFHLSGSNFDDRVTWLAGLYYLEQKNRGRFYRWGLWEFVVPEAGGPNSPWNGSPPGGPLDMAAVNYVRMYGDVVGNPGLSTFFPISFITNDALTYSVDDDSAFFGEVTVATTEQLDLTFGVRITADDGHAGTMTPAGAFRTVDPQIRPQGDPFAGTVLTRNDDPDLGNITTNKFAATYTFNPELMVYASWSEGFTSGGVTISEFFVDPIVLDPEIVTTREIGIKSDWLGGRLRFNGAYFDSEWDGMRVPILPDDPDNPGQKLPFPVNTSEGLAEADGWEFEFVYAPTDRLRMNFGLGIVNTRYINIGDPDPEGINGLQPGLPFAYAPDNSASVGLQYDMDLDNGGRLMLYGQYGWMDEYIRDPANQRIPQDGQGNIEFEPAYGILNMRVMYEAPDADWSLSLWGRNLTDERYVNSGFDARTVWGYDFTAIGRPREVGINLGFSF